MFDSSRFTRFDLDWPVVAVKTGLSTAAIASDFVLLLSDDAIGAIADSKFLTK